MCLHQFLCRSEHSLILATDENQAAGKLSFDQMTNEFDTIHTGHVEIQQNQTGPGCDIIQQLQGIYSVFTTNDG